MEQTDWKRARMETGMESLKMLYKAGRGPSSSHTIGPERACLLFKEKNLNADRFEVILYGSLAKTGKGHGTDEVIRKTLMLAETKITLCMEEKNLPHPNTMDLIALKNGREIDRTRVLSIGGGSIRLEQETPEKPEWTYQETTFHEIHRFCEKHRIRIWEYVEQMEEEDFVSFLQEIWNTMKQAICRGLSDQGILPGGLNVHKRAGELFQNRRDNESPETKENRIMCAYAFAVSEQNACGERIVTAPTCGAAGVLPAVLYYQQEKHGFSDEEILHALDTAGVIGNLVKTNASISGAECGCQAEIGTACAMAAAGLAELFHLSLEKIEYAAEIALEHHLGLTCDPIGGLVQIPCIERNAVAAMRAMNAVNLADVLWNTRKISFDRVVETMKETGLAISSAYKETSEAGLAKLYNELI